MKEDRSSSWYYTEEPLWKEVSVEEFREFLSRYPRKLNFDAYQVCDPPFCTYNDFQLADRWPFSIVASFSDMAESPYNDDDEVTYRIMTNYNDVFASKTGNCHFHVPNQSVAMEDNVLFANTPVRITITDELSGETIYTASLVHRTLNLGGLPKNELPDSDKGKPVLVWE